MRRGWKRQRWAALATGLLCALLLLHRPPSTAQLDSELVVAPAQQASMQRYPYAIDPLDTKAKYFVFQTSGGWGNQRLILSWAMRAANAMDRILIMPMVAPHSMMWYGNDRLNGSQMARADTVLDLDALNLGLVRGVRVLDGHLAALRSLLPGKWKTYIRPKTTNFLPENAIRHSWRQRPERVVFWAKGSMWLCCAGGERMVPYVMFSQRLKRVAQTLMEGVRYNAVHVRRGGGHTRIDRRTAKHYLDLHVLPANMNTSMPLYVATDEKNKTWFRALSTQGGFSLVFWSDVLRWNDNQALVDALMKDFPVDMRGDLCGFLEQLICARADKWTGSDGSTFSWAIAAMRRFQPLREIDWKPIAQSGRYAAIYNNDGQGVDGEPALSATDAARQEEDE